ncbi:hypothetical protein evm_013379 [Chilo suppressalis]|nr:hypothetical protein evm_013379 [Chilo suppressalis]
MGCTSSAPNMSTANPNATDKNFEITEEKLSEPKKKDAATMYADEEYGINDIKVLPTCDNLAETIQLDSNSKSIIDTTNLDLEKDFLKPHVIQVESSPKEENRIEIEEKLSSLKQVVDKVVELFVVDHANPVEDISKKKQLTNLGKERKENNADAIGQGSELDRISDNDRKEQEMEPGEGATSPSQSTSSRATRWETLADIAAELPPSLTVDPLTGQIYTLSK